MNYREFTKAHAGRRGFVLAGLGLVVAFWLIDTAADAYLFERGGFFERLISPEPRELLSLLVLLLLIAVTGAFFRSHIREREEYMERLAESEELNRAILNTAVDGIVSIREDATVVRFNPAAEKIFGYKSEEVIGNNVNILMPEPYHSEHTQYIRSYLTTGQAKIIGIGREVEGRRKDGTTFPLELAVSEMRLDGRRMFTAILRDVTYRKKLEQQKADFYAMITHDIKSPLTVIMGYADLVHEMTAGSLDEDVRRMLADIGKNSRKVADLIEDFLAASRMESDNFSLTLQEEDVRPLLSAVLEEYGPLAEKKSIRLGLELQDGLPAVPLDSKYFRRALSNLLDNAINYTPQGGSVSVRAEASDSGGLVISVSDTGLGIPKSDMDKVFDKYYRSPKTAGLKGSGLGLAIVKGVTEAHGGRVELESAEGKGTTFRLLLPAARPKSEEDTGGMQSAA